MAPSATKLGGWGRSREKAPRRTSRTAVVAVVIRTSRSTRRDLRAVKRASRVSESRDHVPSPFPVGESVPSGRFPDFRIIRRRAPSRTRDRHRSHASSGYSPGASPVTVAGAARGSHPLPSTERNQRTSGEFTALLRQCHPDFSNGISSSNRKRSLAPLGMTAGRARNDSEARISSGTTMPVLDYTLDFDRLRRVGFPEVVLAQGKTTTQIAEICRQLARAHDVLVTRLFPEQWEELAVNPLPGRADYDERSGTLHISVGKPMARVEGNAVLVTAGTADTFVAEEARRTLEYLGVSSTLFRS